MGDALHAGDRLRDWRRRRRLSQLDLASEVGVSTRHLSFVETGRARASRGMLLRLAERLEIPPRERNALLLDGGYAPVLPERAQGDPALAAAMAAVERLLAAHEPYPAAAIDRRWTLLAANRALPAVVGEVEEPALLAPPVNLLRLALHPRGIAPRVENLAAWRAHLLARLRRDAALSGDPALAALEAELVGYPAPPRRPGEPRPDDPPPVAVPLRLRVGDEVLTLLSATMVIGTPTDLALAELAIETLLPGDAATAEALGRLSARA